MAKQKWMTGKEAWQLADKLAGIYGSIEDVAKKLGVARSTIYKWGSEDVELPDVRVTEKLKELAVKEKLMKA